MSELKLTVRRKGNCGQYALCDESGNNAPSHLTVTFVINGPSIAFVEEMAHSDEQA